MSIRRPVAASVLAALAAGLVPALGTAPVLADEAVRTPSNAEYSYDLAVSHRARRWAGSGSVTFENTGTGPLDVVWFRLWANSTGGCGDPAIDVSGVTGGSAGDLAVACTALPVTLDAPLVPGGTATIGFTLEIDVPDANDRFGWYRKTVRMGNALPILAVHDDQEGWHLDPPFSGGESFFSLVADWRVTLHVPAGMETPTTGILEDAAIEGRAREARTFFANDVRDFAWEAGDFEIVRARDRRTVLVRLWYQPWLLEHERAERLVRTSARVMDTFSSAFGAYPYHEVDIVITTFDGFGGMEYPNLVMTIPDPLVISHELAHQWWYGIVGNDQYEDPWIDEGFAQWSQFLPFERLPRRRWPPLPFVGCSMFEWPDRDVRLSSGIDYFSAHPLEYWVPYWQGACALARLAKEFGGIEPFLDVLRAYAADHWSGVATNQDVMDHLAAAAAAAGIEFDPETFFDRWRISRP